MIGFKNPASPAQNNLKRDAVERELARYCKLSGLILIAGHTHRAAFPDQGDTPYFNDGCCVYPYYLTAIEIEDGSICLVKWETAAREDNTLFVSREVLKGPVKLHSVSGSISS